MGLPTTSQKEKATVLNEQDRDILRATLGDITDPTLAQMKQAAEAINLERTLHDVVSHYQSIRDGAAYSAALAAMQYYAFLEPLPNDFKRTVLAVVPGLGGTRGTQQEQQELPEAHIVYRPNFADFCKAHGLDETAMQAVGMGEREEYRGWKRAQSPLLKEITGPDPAKDFRQYAPKGQHIGTHYRPTPPETVEQQIKVERERAAAATPRIQVQPARFRKTTVYGAD